MTSVSASVRDGAGIRSCQPAEGCFHCGDVVDSGSAWPVTIDGVEHSTCCAGCQAVANTINGLGLSGYYQTRSQSPAPARKADADEEARYGLYDTPEAMQQFAFLSDDSNSPGLCADAVFCIDGIRCGACVWLIEHRIARLDGVRSCSVNAASGRLRVRWATNQCRTSDILRAVAAIGYAAYPFDASRQEGTLQSEARQLFRQLFVAGLSMMQVMMYAVPAYLAGNAPLEHDADLLMRWASLLLTLPAVCYSALPFFRNAWQGLRHGVVGMDVPVSIGIAAAFFGSVWAVSSGGTVYFDTVTMFVFLLLASRYLELAARRKAASRLQALSHAAPAAANLLANYPASRNAKLIPAARLKIGDVVLVKPGEPVPADGSVLESATAVDLSLLTGESRAQSRRPGEQVPGGAVALSQPILLRIDRKASDSTLARITRLIEHAGTGKPALAIWADRVAARFVVTLLLFCVAVFAYWQIVDPAHAWPIAIAVLVVSCPCALSLATPSALAAATDRLLRSGVLVVQPHVLEGLRRSSHVIFDKTGTLTEGAARVTGIALMGNTPEVCALGVAARLEATSQHPLATALCDEARRRKAHPESGHALDCTHVPGQGVDGTVDGVRYRIGNLSFVQELCGEPCPWTVPDNQTVVFLGSEHGWVARFDIDDRLRPDARQTVAALQSQGKKVVLLSGDAAPVVQKTALEVGISTWVGECLPEDKLAYVQALQRKGAVVTMVGDGINDLAVLRGADVSFAMGSGSVLAQAHADAILLSGQLHALREAFDTGYRTAAIIRQNLAWASLYNIVAIPAAAMGWMDPWSSAVGMSLSSALVVGNALRLQGRMPRTAGLTSMPSIPQTTSVAR